MLEQVTITCEETGVKQKADVLNKSRTHYEVVLEGTTIKLIFRRNHLNKPFKCYVGRIGSTFVLEEN